MLNIVTYKDISKTEILEYRKCGIGIYDTTSEMLNAELNKFYYSLSNGGCACEFYQNDPGNGYKLCELLDECVELGELILFFYWDDGDYKEIANNVHSYINTTKHIKISYDDFLYTFLTKQFEGNGIIYVITK